MWYFDLMVVLDEKKKALQWWHQELHHLEKRGGKSCPLPLQVIKYIYLPETCCVVTLSSVGLLDTSC